MIQEHATLCERAATRDPAAIDALLCRHLSGLRAFIRLRISPAIRKRESASDLAQSVCREVLENVSAFEYQGEPAFKAWLFTLALRKICQRYRTYTAQKRDIRREATGEDFALHYVDLVTPSQHAMRHEQAELVEAAFDRITDEQREIITLARIAGLSHGEIAERIGESEATCRRRCIAL